MHECIFCKIANGELPATVLYEDDGVMAFRDINPQAPVHVLIIPKKHIPSVIHMEGDDYNIVGHIFQVVNKLADEEGISKEGFRLVVNCGERAGQTVGHIHLHLLGGRDFGSFAG
jgi:histidine triad (HIT) family protein